MSKIEIGIGKILVLKNQLEKLLVKLLKLGVTNMSYLI